MNTSTMKPLMTSRSWRKHGMAALLLIAVTGGLAQATPKEAERSAHPFEPVAQVLTHPRCLNCHQADAPRQTDRGIRHAQGVVRGKDGHGAPGQSCAACHQAGNSANGLVPGAKHWHLAPASMSWQDRKAGEVCRQIKDPARNGNRRSAAQVIEHMSTDPLVLWAWQPGGGRSVPPLSHADFVAALRAWSDRGLPCPD
jgi:hypothetical protein